MRAFSCLYRTGTRGWEFQLVTGAARALSEGATKCTASQGLVPWRVTQRRESGLFRSQ
jgi:hypothetical protein